LAASESRSSEFESWRGKAEESAKCNVKADNHAAIGRTSAKTSETMQERGAGGESTVSTQRKLPQIPSIWELERRADYLRQNTHYLNMNCEQLKADYEYFVKNGSFAPPPDGNKHVDGDEEETR